MRSSKDRAEIKRLEDGIKIINAKISTLVHHHAQDEFSWGVSVSEKRKELRTARTKLATEINKIKGKGNVKTM